jgi:hypothetical protein
MPQRSIKAKNLIIFKSYPINPTSVKIIAITKIKLINKKPNIIIIKTINTGNSTKTRTH